jgi:hypothetical protein
MGNDFLKLFWRDNPMERILAFCGLNCAECEAYVATQAHDAAAIQAVVEKWKVENNLTRLTAESVMCDGCLTASTQVCSYCYECPVRACAQQRGVESCGLCAEFSNCATINEFLSMAPVARDTLNAIHAGWSR